MPDHVGDALADRPAEQRVRRGRERRAGAADRGVHAAVRQRHPGGVQFVGQAAAAVAADRLPHLVQGPPSHGLDVGGLLGRHHRVALGEQPDGLRLHHHQRQRVAEQVVQVAGEAQPLARHGRLGEFLPRVPEHADDGEQPQDDRGDHARRRGPVPDRGEEPPSSPLAQPTRTLRDETPPMPMSIASPARPAPRQVRDDDAGREPEQREHGVPPALEGQRSGGRDRRLGDQQHDRHPHRKTPVERRADYGEVEEGEYQQGRDREPHRMGAALG